LISQFKGSLSIIHGGSPLIRFEAKLYRRVFDFAILAGNVKMFLFKIFVFNIDYAPKKKTVDSIFWINSKFWI